MKTRFYVKGVDMKPLTKVKCNYSIFPQYLTENKVYEIIAKRYYMDDNEQYQEKITIIDDLNRESEWPVAWWFDPVLD